MYNKQKYTSLISMNNEVKQYVNTYENIDLIGHLLEKELNSIEEALKLQDIKKAHKEIDILLCKKGKLPIELENRILYLKGNIELELNNINIVKELVKTLDSKKEGKLYSSKLKENLTIKIKKLPRNEFLDINDKLDFENQHIYQKTINLEHIKKVKVCKAIKMLLIENYRIFINYGPKSDISKTNPLSNAYEIWQIRKKEKIIPNNSKIIKLIDENKEIFDIDEYEICCEFIDHAECFEKSCYIVIENIKEFPNRFEEVINKYV